MSAIRNTPEGDALARRGFLRTVAVGGAALSTGGLSACVGSAVPVGAGGPSDAGAHVDPTLAQEEAARVHAALARLDAQLASESEQSLVHGFGHDDPFSARALRAMTYGGLVADLPEPMRRSQAFAELNATMSDELDQTMMDALWILSNSGQDARELLDRAVRAHPEFVMDYVEALDQRAGQQGVGTSSRLRLRRIATEVQGRLRVESVDGLLTDTASRMARVMEQPGAVAARQRLVVTRTTQAIFAQTEESADGLRGWSAPPPVDHEGDARLMRYTVDQLDRKFRRRRRIALTSTGIGVVALGVGVGVVVGLDPISGFFGLTLGVMSLLLALVLSGLVIRSRRQLRRRIELEGATPR